MDYIELFALVVVYSQSTTVVSTHPTATICEQAKTSFLQQVAPLKPGIACVKDRRYYIHEFRFKPIP